MLIYEANMNTEVVEHQRCEACNQNMKTIKLGYLLKVLIEGGYKKKWDKCKFFEIAILKIFSHYSLKKRQYIQDNYVRLFSKEISLRSGLNQRRGYALIIMFSFFLLKTFLTE